MYSIKGFEMIKNNLVFVFLLISNSLFSQLSTTVHHENFQIIIDENFSESDALTAHLDKYKNLSPPTGILYDRAVPMSDIGLFTGSGTILNSDKVIFDQALFELQFAGFDNSIKPNNTNVPFEEYETTQINLLNIIYDVIRTPEAIGSEALIEDASGNYMENTTNPSIIYDKKRAFIACVNREKIYNGNNTIYRLNSNNYISNYDKNYISLEINFDDGLGLRNINTNTNILVNYNSIGEKTISVKLTNLEGVILLSKFNVTVSSLSLPPNLHYFLKADIPYNGVTNWAVATHF